MASVAAPGTVLTGNSVSSTMVRYSFPAPNDLWIEELIYGMLWDLSSSFRFTQGGAVTTEQAAQLFLTMWENITVDVSVGTIFMYAGIALPSNALPCDGASYLRADYPDLFTLIGVLWGSADSTHFNVPDLRGRTPISSGTGPGLSPRTITNSGGEETHQLTVPETPSHSHTDLGHTHTTTNSVLLGTVTPPPLDALGPNPFPATSGSGTANLTNTGGDGAHNNMQPFMVVNFGITYR